MVTGGGPGLFGFKRTRFYGRTANMVSDGTLQNNFKFEEITFEGIELSALGIMLFQSYEN